MNHPQIGLSHSMCDQQRSLIRTPQHKRPGCSVPKASKKHREHEIAVGPDLRAPASAQGDVNVVAEPFREADVPVSPEGTRVRNNVGIKEIRCEAKPHQSSNAGGDASVPREVSE